MKSYLNLEAQAVISFGKNTKLLFVLGTPNSTATTVTKPGQNLTTQEANMDIQSKSFQCDNFVKVVFC